jgi:aminoglycoside phosphotransferase family enzyme/predicted kinase
MMTGAAKRTRAAVEQADVFRALASPEFYPHPTTAVTIRETHISKVFLTGRYVYKVKKAVNLDFLDFTSLQKRRYYCYRETVLNRRLSENVYLGVEEIRRYRGRYRFGGPGRTVEVAVKMRQLPEDAALVQLLRHGRLPPGAMARLAERLARFYDAAATGDEIDAFGSLAMIRRNCEENFSQMQGFAPEVLDATMVHIVRSATLSFLKRRRELFQARISAGRIRDGHGDLRAGHVYFDDGIQIIDGIEFNDRFRYADTVSDLAFLAMDLDREGFHQDSQELVEAYTRVVGDRDLYTLLDFYKCYRAMVRAKVAGFRLRELTPVSHLYRRTLAEARDFLELAYRYAAQFTRPTLWVVFGLPASGKTRIAGELARILKVAALHSDVVRKQLFGVPSEQAVDVAFESGIYSRESSQLVYGKLLRLAQEELQRGNSVIVDATFSRGHHRDEAQRLASDADANLCLVECRAPLELLAKRLKKRERGRELSDARLHHLERFLDRFEAADAMQAEHRIVVDTSRPVEENIHRILALDHVLLFTDALRRTQALSSGRR